MRHLITGKQDSSSLCTALRERTFTSREILGKSRQGGDDAKIMFKLLMCESSMNQLK
jgi:hypothetical protein